MVKRDGVSSYAPRNIPIPGKMWLMFQFLVKSDGDVSGPGKKWHDDSGPGQKSGPGISNMDILNPETCNTVWWTDRVEQMCQSVSVSCTVMSAL